MTTSLELVESPVEFSTGDRRIYTLNTLPYGGGPTSPVITVNMTSGKDVSSIVLDGSASVSGDDIIWPAIQNLVKGQQYAVDITFTCAGQTYEKRLVIYVTM